MKSRVRDGTGRLKERGDGERRGTGRLKERGKRGKHGSPEGEGGGERHAPAKPRLVAVLRSKLRFTRFLQVPTAHIVFLRPPLSFRLLDCLLSLSLYFPQVPTGSHCLSPPPLFFGLLVSRLLTALLSISLHLPKFWRAYIIFLHPPSLQAVGCANLSLLICFAYLKYLKTHIGFLLFSLL